jgi:hypothetical protein
MALLPTGLAEEEVHEGNELVKAEGEAYSDGMEGLFDSGAELRFGRDKRMSEVSSVWMHGRLHEMP